MSRIFRIALRLTLAALVIGGVLLLWKAVTINAYIDRCYDDYSPAYIQEKMARTAWCAQNQ